MREGLVGLGHPVDVFLALERAALILLGIGELAGQPLGHRLLATRARELDEPADGEGAGPAGRHLYRDLVGGAADTAGAPLEVRGEGLDRSLERLDRLLVRSPREDLERVVDDLLGGRLLAVDHHLVDDLLPDLRSVDRAGSGRADSSGGAA